MITADKTTGPAIWTAQAVTSDDPTVYVDPYPNARGTDEVEEPCRCSNGRYFGPTNARWDNGNGHEAWCFYCNGTAVLRVKVSSVRARARRAAKAAAERRELAPYLEWLAAEKAHRELLAAEEAAYAEQERRNSLVRGFLGEIGDKITDRAAVVTVAYAYDKANYYTGRPETGMLLVLTLDNGQVVKWSSTGAGAFGYERGDRVRILRATVKAHDNYKGQDQTTLKNVRLERIEPTEGQ
ncbi:hypothetical protein [Nocardia abscessus]|uniref:hypothetical protein n=1 Tax=Nocardia abscessus TaxID=120957 RepID=UPI002455D649|nr:hypothetical protein [Nocardia abscessus]